MRRISIVFHWRVVAYEVLRSKADFLALPTRITEWNAPDVDV